MNENIENRYNRACMDMDGMIADFDKSMQSHLRSLMSPGESLEHNDRDFEDEMPHMKARRKLIKRLPGFWANLDRIENGFKLLGMLDQLEFKTSILTKAPASIGRAYMEKWEWLKKHQETKERPVMMVEEKHLVYGRVLCDDWAPYFLPWLKVRPRGCAIAVKQDWNKDIKHPRLVIYDGTNDEEVMFFLKEAQKENPDYLSLR